MIGIPGEKEKKHFLSAIYEHSNKNWLKITEIRT